MTIDTGLDMEQMSRPFTNIVRVSVGVEVLANPEPRSSSFCKI